MMLSLGILLLLLLLLLLLTGEFPERWRTFFL